jgi:hypothetical protein
MVLRNISPFGNFKLGDEIVVPDGVVFDRMYWVEAKPPKAAEPVKADEPEKEEN